MQWGVVHPDAGEVMVVIASVTRIRVIGGYIDRVGGYRDGAGKVHPLPSGRSFSREGGGGQQLSGAGPQVSDMRAGIGGRFVEEDAANEAGRIRGELYTYFSGRGSPIVGNSRHGGSAPNRILRANVNRQHSEGGNICRATVGRGDVRRGCGADRTCVDCESRRGGTSRNQLAGRNCGDSCIAAGQRNCSTASGRRRRQRHRSHRSKAARHGLGI